MNLQMEGAEQVSNIDDIILLKNIGDSSTEEEKDKIEDDIKSKADSKEQSDAHEYYWKRAPARNIEERNDDKKPSQEHSVSKSGQSPSNQQPLQKQEKYDDNCKAQSERDRGQSVEKEHQLEGNRDTLERAHGQSRRFHGQSHRSHGHIERADGCSERYHGHSKRSHGYSERFHGYSERFDGQSGRFYDQWERYQRSLPGGRFTMPFGSDCRLERNCTIQRRNDYFYEKMLQRDNLINMHREITPENAPNFYESKRSYTRYVSRGEETLFLKTRYTGQDSQHKPRGVSLKFNFQALGNQTKLSLNDRFSKLEVMRKRRIFMDN